MKKPQLMGILNVTPDSFSDGGSFFNAQSILRQKYHHCRNRLLILCPARSTSRAASAIFLLTKKAIAPTMPDGSMCGHIGRHLFAAS